MPESGRPFNGRRVLMFFQRAQADNLLLAWRQAMPSGIAGLRIAPGRAVSRLVIWIPVPDSVALSRNTPARRRW